MVGRHIHGYLSSFGRLGGSINHCFSPPLGGWEALLTTVSPSLGGWEALLTTVSSLFGRLGGSINHCFTSFGRLGGSLCPLFLFLWEKGGLFAPHTPPILPLKVHSTVHIQPGTHPEVHREAYTGYPHLQAHTGRHIQGVIPGFNLSGL